jgi:hypothetical protein
MKTPTLCWFCPLLADRGPPASLDFTCTKSSCRVSCRCGDQRGNKKPQTIETKHAPLAQLAEQLTLNQWVPGSSPGGCTTGKTASGLWKHKPGAVLLSRPPSRGPGQRHGQNAPSPPAAKGDGVFRCRGCAAQKITRDLSLLQLGHACAEAVGALTGSWTGFPSLRPKWWFRTGLRAPGQQP